MQGGGLALDGVAGKLARLEGWAAEGSPRMGLVSELAR